MVAASRLQDQNFAALGALVGIQLHGDDVDPDCAESLPGQPIVATHYFLSLDELEIYGLGIARLRRLCRADTTKLMALLRAVQLGLLERDKLIAASKGELALDLDAILLAVQAELPRFGRTPHFGRCPDDIE